MEKLSSVERKSDQLSRGCQQSFSARTDYVSANGDVSRNDHFPKKESHRNAFLLDLRNHG
jgi:hypothetical protein